MDCEHTNLEFIGPGPENLPWVRCITCGNLIVWSEDGLQVYEPVQDELPEENY